MNLEEYIASRKNEDGINEFDLNKRPENTRICVNYVFEYFNNYLETNPKDEETVIKKQRVEKYQKQLREYTPEVREWLVSMYYAHGRHMNRQLKKHIQDPFFLLYDSEAEFHALANEIYPAVKAQFSFLNGYSDMIYNYLKDYHRIESMFHPYDKFFISEDINAWIYSTYERCGVNIYAFCSGWLGDFSERPDTWPRGSRKRSKDFDELKSLPGVKLDDWFLWDYDYKHSSNLFGLDSLYRRLPKKSFIKGKKQELEAVMLYYWVHDHTNDEEYWEQYAKSVLGAC